MSVEEKVKNIIVEQLGVDMETVTPEASFIDDLGADSLDIVELVMTMEEDTHPMFGQKVFDGFVPAGSLGFKTSFSVEIVATPFVFVCNFNASTTVFVATYQMVNENKFVSGFAIF